MANRLSNPNIQFLDNDGEMLSGGLLYFYVTGTSTATDTYSDEELTTPNANPVVLDSDGRAGNIFLDPAVTYKVVLKTSAGVTIWTADPVVDPAANVSAAFQVYAGDPNGNVAGNAGTVGGVGASVVWDITNDLLYVCTTTGSASTAVWSQVAASLSGQVTLTGVISPTSLSGNTDNWAPTGLSTAGCIRASSDAAYNLTGIVAQPTGTVILLENVGSFDITLVDDATSTAANRFQLDGNVILRPNCGLVLRYDGVSSRWRINNLPAPSASDTVEGVIETATQAEMETGTDTDRAVVPGRVHFHAGVAKCWADVTVSGGVPTLAASYNITSITDTGTGLLTITIATDFSGTAWSSLATVELADATLDNEDDARHVTYQSKAAGSIVLHGYNDGTPPSDQDPAAWSFAGFGDL